ncbi:DeoR/GlpR family DNA-binding transcription regulator [Brevundimonas sp. SORGH_AS_0993]|uniref:DeoR/GlpR family DNA-binding transcription regulator n=1 Tax=Brevundimonas sp. SORGH_AS_0993 TaxID=3041794 RepID=UPI002785D957|nr:DeoR/GlpR family DNA-binding transcription regulator [Brevundimonas sp. SORGH_AS_0993]MDQ1154375.1 DeoR family glycerol-3-phosphate regulon repressor [Brevundimonas sp. SORGH_AS_0993]
MNQAIRLDGIITLLQAQGSCGIAELAETFGVSEETVRRDIRRLERDGAVRKVHGGVRLPDRRAEAPWRQRLNIQADAKRRIAARAACLIEPGMTVLFDSSTTAFWLAQEVVGVRDLIVVTNSLEIAGEFCAGSDARVFLSGGAVDATYRAVFDADAIAFVRRFVPDLAIFSFVAVDAARGFLDHEPAEADYARAVLPIARRRVCVTDATKFQAAGRVQAAGWDQIDLFVTDQAPPADVARAAADSQTEIWIA